MSAQAFIQKDAVAQLLGLADGAGFLRARERLEAEGFPPPMPTSLRPLIWRRDAVEAWVQAQGLPATDALAMTPEDLPAYGGNVRLLSEARRH